MQQMTISPLKGKKITVFSKRYEY